MSETLDKPTLTRLAWITELRRQGHRQCRGPWDGKGGLCAILLLHELVERQTGERGLSPVRTAQDHAGLSGTQTTTVIIMNDGGKTFAEIADVVEGWFR